MWKRRVLQVATAFVVLLVIGAAVLVMLWRDRPSLDNIAWPAAPESDDGALSATWLGVTTVLIDDGDTQILIDGFFSRPSLADGYDYKLLIYMLYD